VKSSNEKRKEERKKEKLDQGYFDKSHLCCHGSSTQSALTPQVCYDHIIIQRASCS